MKALTGSTSGFSLPVVERRESRLRKFVAVLSRRRLVILRTTVVLVGIASLACILMTRRYTATAEIQVQKPPAANLGIESAAVAPGNDADPNSGNLNLQTQATILQSPALAMKVIEDLHLEASPAFKPHVTLASWVTSLFSPP